jgi:hypothetical protein
MLIVKPFSTSTVGLAVAVAGPKERRSEKARRQVERGVEKFMDSLDRKDHACVSLPTRRFAHEEFENITRLVQRLGMNKNS